MLTGAISIRDLRGIGVDSVSFSRLFTTVKEFKETVARDFPTLGAKNHFGVGPTPIKARCVCPSNTLTDVLNQMADGCLHRVFVCSESSLRNGRPVPVHVLTQTDVLAIVLKHFARPASKGLMNECG